MFIRKYVLEDTVVEIKVINNNALVTNIILLPYFFVVEAQR